MTHGAPGFWRAVPVRGPDNAAGGTEAVAVADTPARGLLEAVRRYNPDSDLAMLQAAYDVAAAAHQGQKRENGHDYITHPLAVAENLARYRLDDATLATALLHDVLEDTKYSRAQMERRAGRPCAACPSAGRR